MAHPPRALDDIFLRHASDALTWHRKLAASRYDTSNRRTARPHQGISQRIPDDEPDAPRATVTHVNSQRIRRKPVLGGLINEYTPAA